MPQLGPVEDAGEGLWAGPYVGMEPQWSPLRWQAASHHRARDCGRRGAGGCGVDNFRPGGPLHAGYVGAQIDSGLAEYVKLPARTRRTGRLTV